MLQLFHKLVNNLYHVTHILVFIKLSFFYTTLHVLRSLIIIYKDIRQLDFSFWNVGMDSGKHMEVVFYNLGIIIQVDIQ